MEIGRKIYLDKVTGEVLVDTGERMGDVQKTTKVQDFDVYPQLQGKDPSSILFLQLDYGERSSEFSNMESMSVDPITKILTIIQRESS